MKLGLKRKNYGPTPVSPKGQPGTERTTTPAPTQGKQPGHPDVEGHADSADSHPTSPPNTPQSVSKGGALQSPVSKAGGSVRQMVSSTATSNADGRPAGQFSPVGQPGSKTTGPIVTGMGVKSAKGPREPGHPDGMGEQEGGMASTRPPMPSQGVKRKIGKPVGGMRGRIAP